MMENGLVATLAPSSVLITGASRGIGLEFVRQFTQLHTPPTHVFAACRSPDDSKELNDIADKLSCVTVLQMDLTDYASISDSMNIVKDKLGDSGGLNLLINNAGVASRSNMENVTPGEMMKLFSVNAVGPLIVSQTFLPLLRKAAQMDSNCKKFGCNRAAIINISTGTASITENNTGGGYAYRTSKAALNMITKNLSIDFKKDGLLVSALHPGWVKTDMGGERAPVETRDCVKVLMDLMATFQSDEHTGKFYHYSGREMSW